LELAVVPLPPLAADVVDDDDDDDEEHAAVTAVTSRTPADTIHSFFPRGLSPLLRPCMRSPSLSVGLALAFLDDLSNPP
jgi:hypothetical protein